MATKEHWEQTADRYLNDTFAIYKRSHPLPDDMALSNIPIFARKEIIEYLILGFEKEAHELLDDIIPKLRNDLEADLVVEVGQESKERREAELYRTLSNLIWLKTGEVDGDASRKALESHLKLPRTYRESWMDLEDMLLYIEAGEPSAAREYYLEHERKPLPIPPPNFRFTANTRHFLYLHLALAGDPKCRDLIEEASAKFFRRATAWEKGTWPISYLTIVDCARLVRACKVLLNEPAAPSDVLPLLK